MEFTGIIKKEVSFRTGIGAATGKPWRIATYVIESEGPYPQSMVFDVSDGESNRIDRLKIREGKKMTVYFDIRANEWQGKYFNRIQVYEAREEQPEQQPEQEQ